MVKKDLLKILLGATLGGVITKKITTKFSKSPYEREEKILQYYHILNEWLDLRQGNRTLYSYFHDKGYSKVGIYGMRELGQRLYYELKDTDMELYLIDKAADRIWFEEDIISPADGIPEVDVIVVTAAYYFDSIHKELKKTVKCPIISIQDVVNAV